jgi:hypothetical protein
VTPNSLDQAASALWRGCRSRRGSGVRRHGSVAATGLFGRVRTYFAVARQLNRTGHHRSRTFERFLSYVSALVNPVQCLFSES